MNRRDFVKGSLAAVSAASFSSTALGAVRGVNEDIRVAIVGVGSKGQGHLDSFLNIKGVRIVALCDPDTVHLDKGLKKFDAMEKPYKPNTYTDVRQVLDSKEVDAIVVATPNHWHSLISVWACQAGKDVYLEKPITHSISEGQIVAAAVKKYNRIVLPGTQNRSDTGLIPMMEYIHAGNLGAIKYVHTLTYRRRRSIGKTFGPQAIPSTVDYNLWTGPSPLEPLGRKNLHYDWHWQWGQGNGDLGNQGVHETDIAVWALKQKTLPERVISFGGRYGYDDDATTPNTLISVLDYKPAPVICEQRSLPMSTEIDGMDHHRGIRVGVIIQCEQGYFGGGRGGGWIYDNDGKKKKQFKGDGGARHAQHFIDIVRSRKTADLRANVAESHISAGLSHMASIGYRIGSHATAEKAAEAIADYPAAVAAWTKIQDHLVKNKVDLKKTPVSLSPWLEMDPKTERFKQNDEYGIGRWANQLVKGSYRAPFTMPEIV